MDQHPINSLGDMVNAKVAETLGVDPSQVKTEFLGSMDIPALNENEMAMIQAALLHAGTAVVMQTGNPKGFQYMALASKIGEIRNNGGLVCVTPF